MLRITLHHIHEVNGVSFSDPPMKAEMKVNTEVTDVQVQDAGPYVKVLVRRADAEEYVMCERINMSSAPSKNE